jgi:hypothetical protein
MPPVLGEPDDAPLERRTPEERGGLGSCPDPLSSKASAEGEEGDGEVGEEVGLLVPATMLTSDMVPPGVL